LSEVNGNPWASAAEFDVVGCIEFNTGEDMFSVLKDLQAFPVPTSGVITIPLPEGDEFKYNILSSAGLVIAKGIIENPTAIQHFDLTRNDPGVYIIRLTDEHGTSYRVKVIKSKGQ
jgi:hypothetical protein